MASGGSLDVGQSVTPIKGVVAGIEAPIADYLSSDSLRHSAHRLPEIDGGTVVWFTDETGPACSRKMHVQAQTAIPLC
ncbi:hypothetical protein CRG98_019581 [Punica granatum]|uniref:Uncharacterized protein n=1 Tax=Punica granatum TaxID=22663 RepID=A0A2I0JVW3_PUNGR|nr:hypothetical protein CRG98_019581 [Punica granatum]